jgi:hypothetical protein
MLISLKRTSKRPKLMEDIEQRQQFVDKHRIAPRGGVEPSGIGGWIRGPKPSTAFPGTRASNHSIDDPNKEVGLKWLTAVQ